MGGRELVASHRIDRRRLQVKAARAAWTGRVLIAVGTAVVRAGLRVLPEAGGQIAVRNAVNELATSVAISDTGRRAPIASAARLVASADETRRRIERALHDGSQQRLVTLALELHTVKNAVPSELPDLLAQLSHVEEGLRAALEELREIARGVHPAILSESGLHAALKSLARRSAVPVELELGVLDRLPEQLEVAVYYFVSEAVANTVKHAQASVIHVEATVANHVLHLRVRDDGGGGADPSRGSGLVGLKDRVETLGGTITVRSPLGAGTSLYAAIPLPV